MTAAFDTVRRKVFWFYGNPNIQAQNIYYTARQI